MAWDGHLQIDRARWLRGRENRARDGTLGKKYCAIVLAQIFSNYSSWYGWVDNAYSDITNANDLGPDEGREDRVAVALLECVPGIRTVSFTGEG